MVLHNFLELAICAIWG